MKWYKTRIFLYVMFGLIYFMFYKMVGFELAVMIALGTIVGEMSYKQ